jgi:hypothetical protein
MEGSEAMTVRLWLAIWGVLAFIALAAPGVVAMGLFLLLPGLILLAAPTVFVYSAAFALVRPQLPLAPGVLRNLAAAGLVLLLGWVLAQPGAMAGRRRFAKANLPEVVPASPVRLAGHVRLELPKEGRRRSRGEPPGSCPALCAALLDTPGVESVTVAVAGEDALTFRLVPRGGDRRRGADLVRPEAILEHLPNEADSRGASKSDEQVVAAGWALRLALREKLIAEPAPRSPDMTVRIVESRGRRGGSDVSVSRAEILDRGGKALLRRSLVKGSALAVPLHFSGSGSLENFRMGLSRRELRSGGVSGELKPVTELFALSSLARPRADAGAVDELVERLGSACENPALDRDDAAFGLAGFWLATMDWRNPLRSSELSVLGRVIADERIPVPERLYDGYESKVDPALRGALGARIVHASTPSKTRTQLARLLAKMPEGTFATLSEEEQAILQSRELRADAYPLIVRLADQGEAAVPRLLAILRSDVQVDPWSARGLVTRALALAFATLGPKAHGALEEVDGLVNAERSRLLNSFDDRRRWYLALARMGKPVDEFRWFNTKPEADARDRASLRRRVERFDAKEVWNY